MTSPKWRTKGFGGSVYRFPDDPNDYPSVTTLLNGMDKPALKYWAAKVTAETAVQKKHVWGEMLPEEAISYLKSSPFAYSEHRASMGSLIHDLIETGTPAVGIPQVAVAGAVIGDFFGEHYGTELTVVSQELGFAGTADVFTYDPEGRFMVADWKSGGIGYDSQALQLAMLALCDQVVSNDGDWLPLPEAPERGLVIGLREDSYEVLELNLGELAMRRHRPAVVALRSLWEWRKWWGRDGKWSEQWARRVK